MCIIKILFFPTIVVYGRFKYVILIGIFSISILFLSCYLSTVSSFYALTWSPKHMIVFYCFFFQGSCPDFESRINVSKQLREENMSLSAATDRFLSFVDLNLFLTIVFDFLLHYISYSFPVFHIMFSYRYKCYLVIIFIEVVLSLTFRFN